MLIRELPPGTDLLRLQSADPARFPLLLESVAGGNALSRWDLLLATDGTGLRLDDVAGPVRRLDGTPVDGDFLAALDAQWRAQPAPAPVPDDLPFRGGWGLFLAYDALNGPEGSETFRQVARLMEEIVSEWKNYDITLENRLEVGLYTVVSVSCIM